MKTTTRPTYTSSSSPTYTSSSSTVRHRLTLPAAVMRATVAAARKRGVTFSEYVNAVLARVVAVK